MADTSSWGPVIFSTVVPLVVIVLGYVVRLAFRQGQLEERITRIMETQSRQHEENRQRLNHIDDCVDLLHRKIPLT